MINISLYLRPFLTLLQTNFITDLIILKNDFYLGPLVPHLTIINNVLCLVALNLTNTATDENIVNYKWVA